MRLNVTDLESYRYFKNSEDADLDKFLHDVLVHHLLFVHDQVFKGIVAQSF